MRLILRAAALAALSFWARSAVAGELSVDTGVEGSATSWENDTAGFGTLRFGYGFTKHFGAYAEGKLGYGTVDERIVQVIDLGVRYRRSLGVASPYVRLGLVHQHESPGDAVDREPVSTLGGWGSAIRHRAGASASLGTDIRLGHHRRGDVFFSLELSTSFLVNEDGPWWYIAAGAGIGMTFDLGATNKKS